MVSAGSGVLTSIPSLSHYPESATDTFEVQCVPLYTILLALNRTTIDYLSLDVEGAEISVLRTIPFDKVSIKVDSYKICGHFKLADRGVSYCL